MPRHHVYTEARHPTGAVAAGHNLTVYDDAAGTVTSSIYAAASGGSPLANPYVVPETGIVDFWATVPLPYVVAAGDSTPRPMPVVVATPADIGAAGLVANTLTGQQVLTASATNDIPLEVKRDGETYLHMVVQGEGGIKGVGLFETYLSLENTLDQMDPQLFLQNDPNTHVGTIYAVDRRDLTTKHALNLRATGHILLWPENGDPVVVRDASVVPYADGGGSIGSGAKRWGAVLAQTIGNPAHASDKVFLSDGASEWAVTVDTSGVLHATKVRTNYVINPRMLDVYGTATGVPTGWIVTVVGTPTYTATTMLVDGILRPAWRIRYTGVAGDAAGMILCPCTPAASLGNATAASASAYLVTNCSGVTIDLYHRPRNSSNGVIENLGPTSVTTIQPSPTRFKVNATTNNAGVDHSDFQLWISGLGTGDTIDITIAAPMIEKAADAGTYFDSTDADCALAGVDGLSVTKKG